MRTPKYVTDPKPGLKDSIRKWEWLLKKLEKGTEMTYRYVCKVYSYKCGLCYEANERAGIIVGYRCSMCRFPGNKNVMFRCMGGNTELPRSIEKREYDEDPITNRHRRVFISKAKNMLKKLRSIKEMKK